MMPGERFGRLTTVREHSAGGSQRSAHWDCTCECGAVRRVRINNLRGGASHGCGHACPVLVAIREAKRMRGYRE